MRGAEGTIIILVHLFGTIVLIRQRCPLWHAIGHIVTCIFIFASHGLDVAPCEGMSPGWSSQTLASPLSWLKPCCFCPPPIQDWPASPGNSVLAVVKKRNLVVAAKGLSTIMETFNAESSFGQLASYAACHSLMHPANHDDFSNALAEKPGDGTDAYKTRIDTILDMFHDYFELTAAQRKTVEACLKDREQNIRDLVVQFEEVQGERTLSPQRLREPFPTGITGPYPLAPARHRSSSWPPGLNSRERPEVMDADSQPSVGPAGDEGPNPFAMPPLDLAGQDPSTSIGRLTMLEKEVVNLHQCPPHTHPPTQTDSHTILTVRRICACCCPSHAFQITLQKRMFV